MMSTVHLASSRCLTDNLCQTCTCLSGGQVTLLAAKMSGMEASAAPRPFELPASLHKTCSSLWQGHPEAQVGGIGSWRKQDSRVPDEGLLLDLRGCYYAARHGLGRFAFCRGPDCHKLP